MEFDSITALHARLGNLITSFLTLNLVFHYRFVHLAFLLPTYIVESEFLPVYLIDFIVSSVFMMLLHLSSLFKEGIKQLFGEILSTQWLLR